MKSVSNIMTRNVRVVSPSDSVIRAAQAMEELNVGAVPVCDGQRLVGMLTDRDIVVRGVAQGMADVDTKVSEIMSREVKWCLQDQPVDEVLGVMSQHQIRRMPVVDAQHQLVGIVSVGDIATKAEESPVADLLSEISETELEHRAGMLPVKARSGNGSTSRRPA